MKPVGATVLSPDNGRDHACPGAIYYALAVCALNFEGDLEQLEVAFVAEATL